MGTKRMRIRGKNRAICFTDLTHHNAARDRIWIEVYMWIFHVGTYGTSAPVIACS